MRGWIVARGFTPLAGSCSLLKNVVDFYTKLNEKFLVRVEHGMWIISTHGKTF